MLKAFAAVSQIIPASPTITVYYTALPSPDKTVMTSILPTGAILWLSNNYENITTQSVGQWDDQSGNGNNITQTISANQPTVVFGNNGHFSLHFDGVASFMAAKIPISNLSGMAVFLVSSAGKDITPVPNVAVGAELYWPESAGYGYTYFGTYQSTSQFRFGTTQINAPTAWKLPFNWSNTFALSEWQHNGTTSSIWFNGTLVGTFPGKLSKLTGTTGIFMIGQGASSTYFQGDISEVIVYPRAVTDAERCIIERYLMKKYHL